MGTYFPFHSSSSSYFSLISHIESDTFDGNFTLCPCWQIFFFLFGRGKEEKRNFLLNSDDFWKRGLFRPLFYLSRTWGRTWVGWLRFSYSVRYSSSSHTFHLFGSSRGSFSPAMKASSPKKDPRNCLNTRPNRWVHVSYFISFANATLLIFPQSIYFVKEVLESAAAT